MKHAFAMLAASAAMAMSCESNTAPAPAIDHLELVVSPVRPFYPVHDTARALATVYLDNGTSYRLTRTTWRSLDSARATVDGSGLISMTGPGVATIDVDVEGHSARTQVTIRGLLHLAAIAQSETWLVADTPHVVERPLTVGSADTTVLTIEPGVRVLFRPGSGLAFGGRSYPGPGRLVIPAGGPAVSLEGESAVAESWIGLSFAGPGRSELRGVTFRHCGAAPRFGARTGCLTGAGGESDELTLLMDDVTIIGAPDVGMTLASFVAFAPGSRKLSIVDGTGHIASISPEMAGQFPLGGQFEGNAENAIWIGSGQVRDSTTWVDAGVPWRLVGGVLVEGPNAPVLTIPPGLVVRADAPATFTVATNGLGGLILGDAAGPPLVLEPTGTTWGGIIISSGALVSALTNVELRNCGTGACIALEGVPGTTLRVRNVTIRNPGGVGVALYAEARFDSSSANLVITGAGGVPLSLPAEAVASIPSGDYRFNGTDAIRVTQGTVTRTTSWRNLGVPYQLPVGLAIGNPVGDPTADPVLTLEPGVTLELGTNTIALVASFGYQGARRAIGTPTDPIRFTSATPGIPGSWWGLELGRQVDARTRLEYVEILDAGAGDPGYAGAVRMWVDPGGVLRNTTIRRSPNCGVVLLEGAWATDYTDPSLGNAFIEVAGPARCLPPP